MDTMLQFQVELDDRYFNKFSDFIYEKCAIKLLPLKKTMLTSRLNRRLRALGIKSFKEYYAYVTSAEGQERELVYLINEVSTNKTDFFREPDHFSYLGSRLLPDFVDQVRGGERPFRVWSAGCSSGEEPYTFAMVMADYQAGNAGFDFFIDATDISTKVLAIAERGIYADDRLTTVEPRYLYKHMMRGKGRQKGLHCATPEIRRKIGFHRLNLLDPSYKFSKNFFDLICCRNVIIYFDRETQKDLFDKFFQYLRPGGYIFIGHSETMIGMEGKLKWVAPAIYQKIAR